jgi:hypothetical protein
VNPSVRRADRREHFEHGGYPRLPDRFGPKVVAMPECSYGAVRVVLVLKNGRRVHDVIVGEGAICKIGARLIESESDLDFSVSDIQDVERG